MLRLAESIQVSEYRVALQMSGIADQQMLGIGVHTHDLGAYIVCAVCQIDAVAKGFTHFRLAIDAGQSLTCLIFRQQCLGLYQYRCIYGVEFVYDLSGLFDHGQLITTYGNGGRLESGNIGSLADGIGKKSHRDAGFEVTNLNLTLYGRVSL